MKRLLTLSLLVLAPGLALAERLPPPIWGAASKEQLQAMAEGGSPEQQYLVARELHHRSDMAAAIVWYRKAADAGVAKAEHDMGVFYENGEGVEQDRKQALAWYRKAAEQGLGPPLHNLASYYAKGIVVPRAPVTAAILWRKASEMGIPNAQYALGKLYFEGNGVRLDYNNAIYWMRKAAEQGMPHGYFGLGVILERDGRENPAAFFYYTKAAELGMPQAVEAQRNLLPRLRPEQLKQAQDMLASGVKLLDVPAYDPGKRDSATSMPPMPDYALPTDYPAVDKANPALLRIEDAREYARELPAQCKLRYPQVDVKPSAVFHDWEVSNEDLVKADGRYRNVHPDAVKPKIVPGVTYGFGVGANGNYYHNQVSQTLDQHQGDGVQFCTDEINALMTGKYNIGKDDPLWSVLDEMVRIYGWN